MVHIVVLGKAQMLLLPYRLANYPGLWGLNSVLAL